MLKKIFAVLIISLILLSQASFIINAAAASCAEYCGDPSLGEPTDEICLCSPVDVGTIPELVQRISNYVFLLALVIAPLMVLWGAFTIMTAAGRVEKVTVGKNIIIWTSIGLGIAFLSKAIISIIKSVLS